MELTPHRLYTLLEKLDRARVHSTLACEAGTPPRCRRHNPCWVAGAPRRTLRHLL